jgi:hypothetical protein
LIKWCTQKSIIIIPRSNNIEHLLTNFIASNDEWILHEEDIKIIESTPQNNKGHCLQNVYEKNCSINLWKPLFLTNSILDNKCFDYIINDLITGNISCIIVNDVLTKSKCEGILKKMEDKQLLQNQLPYNNYGIHFRQNEIGITIDNLLWRDNPNKYFNECIAVNKLFENIFDIDLNPFELMFSTVRKIVGDKYILLKNKQNDIECPNGVFRIFSSTSHEFPYHTDGFNYGNYLNKITNIDNKIYPMIMDQENLNVIAIILVLQQTKNKNEIDLFNISVDDLELMKDEIGMYSHWMGTKYTKNDILECKLQNKQFFSPILNTGDLYIFSASRLHKLNNLVENKNRIVLATFGYVKNNEIIIYQ